MKTFIKNNYISIIAIIASLVALIAYIIAKDFQGCIIAICILYINLNNMKIFSTDKKIKDLKQQLSETQELLNMLAKTTLKIFKAIEGDSNDTKH